MKKNVLLVVSLALVLVGCVTPPPGGEREALVFKDGVVNPSLRAWIIRNDPFVAAFARPVRLYPTIYVDSNGGAIIVDQEPIHVVRGEGQATAVKIEWSIADSGYYFADDNAIQIAVVSGQPQIENCKRKPNDNTTFICKYTRSGRPAKYSYTITITDGVNKYTSDPYIAND